MNQISEHVWIYPFEEEKDRPNIGYIKDDDLSVAIEAGHSKAHLMEFYQDLHRNNFPLPDLTVVTHWHWDHTFAMHAVHGATIAEERTNQHLLDEINKMDPFYQKKMMDMDAFIHNEYADQKMIIVPANITFKDFQEIHTANLTLQLMHVLSPHTNDSTVILVKEEKVLFIGDAISGPYPDYDHPSQKLLAEFKGSVSQLNFSLCVGGHWPVQTKDEFLN